MSIEDNLKEVEQNIEDVRNKVQRYKKIRLYAKILGNIGFIAALFLQAWLSALLLWILFFPDFNDFIKFFKTIKNI